MKLIVCLIVAMFLIGAGIPHKHEQFIVKSDLFK